MVSISPMVSDARMVELQEHRSRAALELAPELQHHLAGPVVALDEALAAVIGGIAAERSGHIGAGRTVVVLDQRIDLEALQICELGAGMKGHGVTVAGIGRVLIRAEQITRGRQPEPAGGAAGEDHGLGAHHQKFTGAGVDPDRAGDVAVGGLQQPRRHESVGDGDLQAA
jgi:hypothetical protein